MIVGGMQQQQTVAPACPVRRGLRHESFKDRAAYVASTSLIGAARRPNSGAEISLPPDDRSNEPQFRGSLGPSTIDHFRILLDQALPCFDSHRWRGLPAPETAPTGVDEEDRRQLVRQSDTHLFRRYPPSHLLMATDACGTRGQVGARSTSRHDEPTSQTDCGTPVVAFPPRSWAIRGAGGIGPSTTRWACPRQRSAHRHSALGRRGHRCAVVRAPVRQAGPAQPSSCGRLVSPML